MAFLIILLLAIYILIGSSLGGFYYYLMYREDSWKICAICPYGLWLYGSL